MYVLFSFVLFLLYSCVPGAPNGVVGIATAPGGSSAGIGATIGADDVGAACIGSDVVLVVVLGAAAVAVLLGCAGMPCSEGGMPLGRAGTAVGIKAAPLPV